MNPTAADEPHPDVQQMIQMLESTDVPDFSDLSPPEARQLFETFSATGDPGIEIASVTDDTVEGPDGGIPIRIYEPEGSGDRPLVLYFHGGGWVIGSIETHDAGCRALAAETGYAVVSVDYRLAPEHPFPAALEDCYATLEWATQTDAVAADTDRIVLAGDSAGGNLSAALPLLSDHRDGPAVDYQVLIYPATGDIRETDSFDDADSGFLLDDDLMEWFRELYFERDIDEGNVFAAPRLAHDLSGVPPATVVTAGFDPLRDDGAAYAKRLEDEGVPVTYRNYPDMIHGFAGMLQEPVALDAAEQLYAELADDLHTHFG